MQGLFCLPSALEPSRYRPQIEMEAIKKESALEATRTDDQATREGIQRLLDQCLERGQLHRPYHWATKLNEISHGDEQDA